jgi:predicted N-acetyltransferase YhbS
MLVRVVMQPECAASRSREAYVEFHVRSARLTDLDASIRLLRRDSPDQESGRQDADFLRNMLYVPAATVVVAEAERRVVGAGVLCIRPSVGAGPFVGTIDELGMAHIGLDDPGRLAVGSSLVEHLVRSARNKGCTRVEVAEPLASADPMLWEQTGFASRGALLSRPVS